MTSFSVKAGEFEGPLDLLLTLVEERKMLVSDVSLVDVADAFLQFVSTAGTFPIGEAAHFVVVASTLLLLKSRALLPVLALSDDEEGDIKDLETRLQLLQIIRNAAKSLQATAGRIFFGEGARISEPLFTPSRDLSVDSLRAAMQSALQNAPKKVFVEEVEVKAVVSLDEMIERLTARVQQAISMSFKDFAGGATSPHEVVVGFLAILELVKRGFANVTQDANYADITIEYAGAVSAPRYE
jgi:segregation and condensation protein A